MDNEPDLDARAELKKAWGGKKYGRGKEAIISNIGNFID